MSKHNFVVSEPKSTNFSAFNVELIVVENAVNRLSVSLIVPENSWSKSKVVRKRAHCRFWVGRNEQTELLGAAPRVPWQQCQTVRPLAVVTDQPVWFLHAGNAGSS